MFMLCLVIKKLLNIDKKLATYQPKPPHEFVQ